MIVRIQSNRIPLVFAPDTKIRIVQNSPIFGDTNSGYSFPFDLPVAENCVALGHPQKLHSVSADPYAYDVVIESNVLPFKSGILYVSPADDNYECSLVCGDGLFNNLIKDKNVADLVDIPVDMGDDDAEFIETAEAMKSQAWPDIDFAFPLMYHSEPYDNETISAAFQFLNFFEWYNASPSYVLNILDDSGFHFNEPAAVINRTSYVPCPFVFAVLKNIVSELGLLNVDTPVFDDSQINQLIFVHNKSIDLMGSIVMDDVVKVGRASDWTITPVSSGSRVLFDDDSTPPFQNPNGYYHLQGEPYTQGYFTSPVGERIWQFHYRLILYNPNEFSVNFTIGYGSNSMTDITTPSSVSGGETITVEGSINLYTGNGLNSISLKMAFGVDDTLVVKTGSILDIIPISDTVLVGVQKTFNLADHIPKIGVNELLTDLKYLFGIIPFYSTDSVGFEFFKDIYAQKPASDLSAYMLNHYEKSSLTHIKSVSLPDGFDSADFAYTTPWPQSFPYSTVPQAKIFMMAEGMFYLNDCDEYYNFAWSRWKQDINKRQILDASSEGSDITTTSTIPEMVMVSPNPSGSANWAPVITLSDKLVSPFNASSEDSDCMLAFWRGMIVDSSSDTYPFATPYAYRVNGALPSGITTQLRFNGSYGLYGKYLTELIAMFNAENNVLSVEMNLPQSVLKNLAFNKTYSCFGLKVLIKSIDFEIDILDNIIQPVSLEIVKL